MIHEKIPGANRANGAPAGWNEEEDGPIQVLWTRDEEERYSPLFFMVSQFKPTPEELEVLNNGGSIRFGINCFEGADGVRRHPVIRLPYVVEPGAI